MNIIKKFLSFSIGSFVSVIIGVISTPIITRLLSPNNLGEASVFAIISNLILLFSLMGADQSFARYYYEMDKVKELFYKCLSLSLLGGVISSIIILLFGEKILELFFSDINNSFLLLLIMTIFIQIINRYIQFVFRMNQEGKAFSLNLILLKVLELASFLIIFLFLGDNKLTLILAQTVNIAIVIVVFLPRALKILNSYQNNEHSENIIEYKSLVKYGFPLIWTLIISWGMQFFDRIALSIFSSSTDVGLYAASMKLIAILTSVQLAFSTYWTPLSFSRYTNNEESSNKIFFNKILMLITLILSFLGLATILFKDLILLLLGNQYNGVERIVPFLVFAPILYTISEVTVIGVNFKKKTQIHFRIAIITGIVSILTNLLLTSKFGLLGAAISSSITYFIFFIIRTYHSEKLYKYINIKKEIFITLILLYVFAVFNYYFDKYSVSIIGSLLYISFVYFIWRSKIKIIFKKE